MTLSTSRGSVSGGHSSVINMQPINNKQPDLMDGNDKQSINEDVGGITL